MTTEQQEVSTPTPEEQPTAPETPEAPETPTEPETGAVEQETPAEGTEQAEVADDAPPSFDAELAKARGEEAAPPPEPERQKPGKSFDDIKRELDAVRHQRHAKLRSEGFEPGMMTYLQTRFGLNREQAEHEYNSALRLHMNNALADHDAYTQAEDVAAIEGEGGLNEEQLKVLKSRAYRNRQEMYHGLIEVGRQQADEEFKQRVKKGDYITRAEARKVADDFYQKGVAKGERNRSANSSGNNVDGHAPSSETRAYWDIPVAERKNMTNEQKDAAIARSVARRN